MNKRQLLIALGLVTVGTLAGFGLKTVLAEGIPSPNPLYYSGTLTEGGMLVNGTRAITVNLWPDGTAGGAPLCQTVASTAPVAGGRFRIALASACKAIINQSNNVFVEVIDGATSLGRSPIGAVAYAVEADHAVNATNATSAINAVDGGGISSAISSLQGQIKTPTLQCVERSSAATATSRSFTGGGAMASCLTGEVITGCWCAAANGGVEGTAAYVGSALPANTCSCIPSGTVDPAIGPDPGVSAQVSCCKIVLQ